MMIAFDTNLLVRIAVNDDIAQANIALELTKPGPDQSLT
jgi:predicted nucleic-acid-binding protein